jgi:uncharacterized Rossmann fold enzyme
MDFEVWEPYYREIISDFGFEREEDTRAGLILSELIRDRNLVVQEDLENIIMGKNVAVIGGSKALEKELEKDLTGKVIIAADGTTSILLNRGLIPHIIVTDLDGKIQDQISANSKGAVVAIHAHGDNIEQVKLYTPQFKGKVLGTVQGKPPDTLFNFGGFTDGDRGVFMAHHFKARNIELIGFDFENVGDKPNCDKESKFRKLQWAKRLISMLGIMDGR